MAAFSIQGLVRATEGALVSGDLGVPVAGVSIDSRTLQSRRIQGLFLAGEVLDLDGPIGGYNFQAAWSTGWLAGAAAAGTG